ncbi:tetratricopeptide repeat family protein [Formosa agariphila KMM 3901]|uniref:Tetratricopeptide repeat family protein n=1 Tax=Formosa agariphila (strain DSM 15362 / KCTC 12365 / LMG 23005 / KMM 3901 / M-2Alg 35-1) TaxID=1347342 RepID=T2KR95_FORAG|nr:tetratricopeptide repeat protein [Formosa agariphila]CDF80976.1 tetratricopeptide repeat family protein [Formosa agariphila KMM 3901]
MILYKTNSFGYSILRHNTIKTVYLVAFIFLNVIHLNAQDQYKDSNTGIDTVFTELKNRLDKANQDKNDVAIMNSHIQLANFYLQLGLENEAIKHYHDALEKSTKKDTTAIYIGNKMSNIYLSLKQYENAKSYLTKSLSIAEQLDFKKGKAECFGLLGSVAEKEANYTLALKHQEESLTIYKTLSDSTGLATTYENIGSIYEDLQQYDNALKYFLKAHSLSNNIPTYNQINILNNIGDAYRKMMKSEEALPYTLLALQQARTSKTTHQEESALKDLALNYADLDDYKTAFDYIILYQDLNKKETEHKDTELVRSLQILYEVEEHEAEVKLLNKQNEVNKIRQNIILLASTFIILMLLGWFLHFRKRKKQQSKIQHYKNELLQANIDKKTQEEIALQRENTIKTSALTNYSLHLAHKNKMISDITRTLNNIKDRNSVLIKSKIETLIKDIDLDISQEQEWTEFINFFEQIHPHFSQNLKKDVTKELTASELRLCVLLRLNLSSKEIASILRITPDSVRIARYRLRKKLPIDSKEDLQVFLLNL